MSYESLPDMLLGDYTGSQHTDHKASIATNWHNGPSTLRLGRIETIISWSYDIILTLAPACFFGLALAALRLDHQPISAYGERVVNLTILSPSVYPIVFAAVASRFFKNLARWRLEKRQGIELATLEQVFGSQNLAGAVERLLFVRAKIPIGIAILLIWCSSPIGGQSAARLLRKEGLIRNGTIFYTHAASQDPKDVASYISRTSVTALYSTSFLSSPTMKKNVVDFWDWPRIPQWPKSADPNSKRIIDLDAVANGDESYTSLLGVHIQGLDEFEAEAQYQFSVESLYHDFSCNEPEVDVRLNETKSEIPKSWSRNLTELLEPSDGEPSSFAAFVSGPDLEDLYPDPERDPTLLSKLPPFHLLYLTVDSTVEVKNNTMPLTIFNCSIHPVVVETDIACNSSAVSTNCRATHQRKMNKYYHSKNSSYTALMTTLSQEDRIHPQWSAAQGVDNQYLITQYIANSTSQFEFGDDFDMKLFSARMTTAFNTFVDASVYSLDHAYASFRLQPGEDALPRGRRGGSVMNTTEAVVKSKEEVYRVNKTWLTILIITTELLGLLGILGLVLQLFIRGPDILGFVSSLTRENVYMELPPGGSALDGPARARALGSLRVHLADVKPKDENGYIAFTPAYAFKQDDGEEEGSWRDLSLKRHYQ